MSCLMLSKASSHSSVKGIWGRSKALVMGASELRVTKIYEKDVLREVFNMITGKMFNARFGDLKKQRA